MIKKLKTIFVGFACLYFGVVIVFWLCQRKLEYLPQQNSLATLKSAAAEHKLDIVFYKTKDNLELLGLFHKASTRNPVIIFFNGNKGELDRAFKRVDPLIKAGFNVYINIYRGFPPNSGKITESAFFSDAKDVYDFIKSQGYNENQIISYGYSLGSGVAIYLASSNPCAGLIVESGFDSMVNLAKDRYAFLPVELILKDQFFSEKYIKDITAPKLFIHGNFDKVVPINYGKRLYDISLSPKQFIEIDGGTHDLALLNVSDKILAWLFGLQN